LRSWPGSGTNVSAPERRRLPDSSGIRSLAAEWAEELAAKERAEAERLRRADSG
jgi:hypothetical protein